MGTLLLIAAAVLVVYAFQNAGESGGNIWTRAIFIAPLITGLACWVALFLWGFTVDHRLKGRILPAFPTSLFRNRAYSTGVICTLALGYPLLLIIFSFTTRAQVVSGKSPLIGGLMLLPMLGTMALGGAVAGKINAGKYRVSEILLGGACFITLGCGLLTTVREAGDDAKALGFLVFTGLGVGLSTTAATILALIEAPAEDRGM